MNTTLPFLKILVLSCFLALVGCGESSTTTATTVQCADSNDNDSDGLTDLNDPGCSSAADDDESDDPVATTQCADGSDNDGDGLTDLSDPGCANASDDDESDDPVATTQCADGSDNDGDGLIDLTDPGCANAADDDESDPATSSAHSADRANSYDDTWESAWITNAKNVIATPVSGITKTVGKVLQVGDSMTFSFAYGSWARSGIGRTTTDQIAIDWMHAGAFDITDGWNLSQNGTTAQNNMGWGSTKVENIFTDTDLNDAQFAVLMMNVPTSDPNDLTVIEQRVDQFIAVGIVPVLSTIPPRTSPTFDTQLGEPYNEALRALAQQLSLPLIDFKKELILRRPNGTWENTLISSDGVHPSGTSGIYMSNSNPYDDGGDPTTHTTGDAALWSGYLLRTWLTVQKIKEIKQKVID